MIDVSAENGATGEIRTPDRLVRRQAPECAHVFELWWNCQRLLGNIRPRSGRVGACFHRIAGFLFPSFAGLLLAACAGVESYEQQDARASYLDRYHQERAECLAGGGAIQIDRGGVLPARCRLAECAPRPGDVYRCAR